jgi:hypothetical protein
MTRLQFWILTASSLIVTLLFAAEAWESHELGHATGKLAGVRFIIHEGEAASARWRNMAARVSTLVPQDPALRDLMLRQRIDLPPAVPATAPTSAPVNPAKTTRPK